MRGENVISIEKMMDSCISAKGDEMKDLQTEAWLSQRNYLFEYQQQVKFRDVHLDCVAASI